MSKIGKLPIMIPPGIDVSLTPTSVIISSPGQQYIVNLPVQIKVDIQDNVLAVSRQSDAKKVKSNHGAIRANIQNIITGLQKPWQKSLELVGTGYKVFVSSNKITLNVGFIKPVEISIPEGLTAVADSETSFTISGPDKVKVGQLASSIRKIRPPEPYKGKGIRYQNEFIKLKPGKTAKTSA